MEKELYIGPSLKKSDKNRPFWDKTRTKPLGGCLKTKLIYVIDGDTAAFLVDGAEERVRFFIINTPEIYPDEQLYGLEAKEYVIKKLGEAQEILLQSDVNDVLRDNTSSKRLLAWVWVDGQLLNYLLVLAGLATVKYVNSPKMKYLRPLKKAEARAKKLKRGIFTLEKVR